MIKVGISRYFATGEGLTVFIAAGSEDEIREFIPTYFHRSLIIFTPEEWVTVMANDYHESMSEEEKEKFSEANAIKAYAPVLWKQMEALAEGDKCVIRCTLKHHTSYA